LKEHQHADEISSKLHEKQRLQEVVEVFFGEGEILSYLMATGGVSGVLGDEGEFYLFLMDGETVKIVI
jgi:hypothetical protein